MKKFICFALSLFTFTLGFTQVPTQINYQGIARNSVGNVLPNQPISVRLSIKDGGPSGTIVYSETRNVTTNAFGLFFYSIGGPGATSVTGTVGGVNWASGNKYLQVEIDPKGGSGFIDAGTTQLLSVPYSLYAAGASPTGNAGGSLAGTYPNPTIANGAITLPMIAPGVLPTTLPPSGPAGGSLTGLYPNPLIANAAITQAMLGPGITLPPDGPAGGSLTGSYPNPLIANGAVVQAMIGPGVTLPPSGPAGGSLTGSYPNPLIANGAVVQAMIGPGVTLPPSGPAGGDLSGNYPNPSVSKILGRTINNTVPAINDVLTFDGTNWGPVNLGSISGNVWAANGTNIYNTNTGNVGIGINNPSYKLHVSGGDGFFSDSVIASAIRIGSPAAQVAIRANGIYGIYSNGSSVGVYGNSEGKGVIGEGNNSGVHGYSSAGIGVIGHSSNDKGVYGDGETGVFGTGDTYGVHGISNNIAVLAVGGVHGVLATGTSAGVRASSSINYGLYGLSNDGIGTYGTSTNSHAVAGFSTHRKGGYFVSQNEIGLWASTLRADNNWAGVFEGNVYTYNAYQVSDEGLKKNIQEVDNALGIISRLKPRAYEFRNDGKLSALHLPQGKHFGVMAQDLEELLPRLVSELESPLSVPFTTDNSQDIEKRELAVVNKSPQTIKIKAVNYTGLIPIMIKGMQEQQEMIKNQQEKITTLEGRLERLEAQISALTKTR